MLSMRNTPGEEKQKLSLGIPMSHFSNTLPLCYVMISKGRSIFLIVSEETNDDFLKFEQLQCEQNITTEGKEKQRKPSNNFIYPPS